MLRQMLSIKCKHGLWIPQNIIRTQSTHNNTIVTGKFITSRGLLRRKTVQYCLCKRAIKREKQHTEAMHILHHRKMFVLWVTLRTYIIIVRISTESPEVVIELLNILAPELFFFNFSTPVYKMWIIQEPNKLALWNKLQFEEKKTENIEHV